MPRQYLIAYHIFIFRMTISLPFLDIQFEINEGAIIQYAIGIIIMAHFVNRILAYEEAHPLPPGYDSHAELIKYLNNLPPLTLEQAKKEILEDWESFKAILRWIRRWYFRKKILHKRRVQAIKNAYFFTRKLILACIYFASDVMSSIRNQGLFSYGFSLFLCAHEYLARIHHERKMARLKELATWQSDAVLDWQKLFMLLLMFSLTIYIGYMKILYLFLK